MTKTQYSVTLPDGSIASRKSARPYTHAVVVIITEELRARRIATAERCIAQGTHYPTMLDKARALVVGSALGVGWSMSAGNAAKMADKDRKNHPDARVYVTTEISRK